MERIRLLVEFNQFPKWPSLLSVYGIDPRTDDLRLLSACSGEKAIYTIKNLAELDIQTAPEYTDDTVAELKERIKSLSASDSANSNMSYLEAYTGLVEDYNTSCEERYPELEKGIQALRNMLSAESMIKKVEEQLTRNTTTQIDPEVLKADIMKLMDRWLHKSS